MYVIEDNMRAEGVHVKGTLNFQDCMDAIARQWSLITGYEITGTAVLKPEFREKYKNKGGKTVEQAR